MKTDFQSATELTFNDPSTYGSLTLKTKTAWSVTEMTKYMRP